MSSPGHGATPITVAIWEDTGLTAMARLLGRLGTAVTISTVASITCKVWDKPTGDLVATVSLTPGATLFDALQTDDPRWTRDSTGYNFLAELPASAFPTYDAELRVGFLFTPGSGEPFGFAVDVSTRRLLP